MSSQTPNPHPKKRLEAYKADLQDAVIKAFNPHPTTYRKVVVQFISFTKTDISGLARLEQALGKVFREVYGFDTRFMKITTNPQPNATIVLGDMATQLSKECTAGSLLILVFSGHGRTDTVRGHPILTVAGTETFEVDGSTANWNSAVDLLASADCDVLQLLDCCCAGQAVGKLDGEIIGAATNTTSAEASNSFTTALIDTLKTTSGRPWTVAQLHGHMMRQRKAFSLDYLPIFASSRNRSIVIQKLGRSSVPGPSVQANSMESIRMTLSVDIDGQMNKNDVEDIKKWLLNGVPAGVYYIDVHLEGIYDSESTLLIFTVPVELWNFLQNDNSYHLIGLTRGRNKLLRSHAPVGVLSNVPVGMGRGNENVKPGSSK